MMMNTCSRHRFVSHYIGTCVGNKLNVVLSRVRKRRRRRKKFLCEKNVDVLLHAHKFQSEEEKELWRKYRREVYYEVIYI